MIGLVHLQPYLEGTSVATVGGL